MSLEIYAKSWCPYCQRALALLDRLRLDYVHHDVTNDHELERQMVARAGRTSVPQIFIGELHVGGSDELFRAYHDGALAHWLQQAADSPRAEEYS